MSQDSSDKSTTAYELLGGEAKLRELVSAFYRIMDTSPESRIIRDMHPQDLRSSEEKLFMFMSGWWVVHLCLNKPLGTRGCEQDICHFKLGSLNVING